MKNKKTLVIGASTNPNRYSYQAVGRLTNAGHEVIALGKNEGELFGIKIAVGKPMITDIHTVTIYIRPQLQSELSEYIISLKPKRVIFNPGAENTEFKLVCEKNGIETLEACTLVMLSIGAF